MAFQNEYYYNIHSLNSTQGTLEEFNNALLSITDCGEITI